MLEFEVFYFESNFEKDFERKKIESITIRRRRETAVTVIFQLRSRIGSASRGCTFPPQLKNIYIYIVEKVSFNLAGVHSIKRTGRRGKIANVLANKSNSAKE